MEQVFNTTSQGMLAKLLARENVQVHVGNYSTASFDTENRVLRLPTWNTSSKQVSDLLVGHEVGHALYTPKEGIEKFQKLLPDCPFSILNIVEDIRIERLIQDQYPGLISSFNKGYAELHLTNDLFKIHGCDINKFGFADRLNLKAKLRDLVDVKFSKAEELILKRSYLAETFDDVIAVVADIYDMVKGQKQPKPDDGDDAFKIKDNDDLIGGGGDFEADDSEADTGDDDDDGDSGSDAASEDDSEADTGDDGNSGSEGGSEDDDSEANANNTNEESNSTVVKSNDKKKSESSNTSQPYYGSVNDELNSQTQQHFDSNIEDMQHDYKNVMPILSPSPKHFEQCVTSWKDVMDGRAKALSYKASFLNNPEVDADWKTFKGKTQQNIQSLITDFERRKAAWQYSRATNSESGDLDMNALPNFKFDDNIFRSISNIANAKNHGMMFFIDYSGSMRNDIYNVLDHTLSLVMFCNSVGIKFDVYCFSSSCYWNTLEYNNRVGEQLSLENTNIFNVLSSSMPRKTLDLALRQLRAQSFLKNSNTYGNIAFASKYESMAGTPLINTLVVAHDLVIKFRAAYKVQKMSVIFLTDGDDNQGVQCVHSTRLSPEEQQTLKMKAGIIPSAFILRLPGGNIVNLKNRMVHVQYNYAVLVESLKQSLNCMMIGFFISNRVSHLNASGIRSIQFSKSGKKFGGTDQSASWADAAAIAAEIKFKSFKKQYPNNGITHIDGGYNFQCYFLVNTSKLTNNMNTDEFDPASIDAQEFKKETISKESANKLAKEFGAFSLSKKGNRLILGKFAELIA